MDTQLVLSLIGNYIGRKKLAQKSIVAENPMYVDLSYMIFTYDDIRDYILEHPFEDPVALIEDYVDIAKHNVELSQYTSGEYMCNVILSCAVDFLMDIQSLNATLMED